MTELTRLLGHGDESARLDVAALEIAGIEYPDLDHGRFLEQLDTWAGEIGRQVGLEAPGDRFLDVLTGYLTVTLGFTGNQRSYYDVQNSCLNRVIERRTGLPITLSLLYIEIGRRLGRDIHGIGLPGHFLAGYRDSQMSAYIDPFHGGELLDRRGAIRLISALRGETWMPGANDFGPASKRQIALRMLNNLRGAYLRKQQWSKVIQVLDVMMIAPQAGPDRQALEGELAQARQAWARLRASLN